jgi:hypothetical protein
MIKYAVMQNELPTIIEQFLLWKALESGLYAVSAVAIFLTCVYVDKRLGLAMRAKVCDVDDNMDRDDFRALYFGAGSVIRLLYGASSLTIFSIEWFMILVAPRIWLLEYVETLTK